MSPSERDPFALLARVEDPEPDRVVMDATIAQSREAFLARQTKGGKQQRQVQWHSSLAWLMPAGVGVLALVAAIVVAPGLMQTSSDLRPAEQVADAPLPIPSMEAPPTLSRGDAPAPEEAPEQTGGVRMGMQPSGQPARQIDPQSVPMSVFAGDAVRLGYRLTPSVLLLYLPDLSPEQPIDQQGILSGEAVEILAAFAQPEEQIVAVQLRVDATRFWRVYRPIDGAYTRDADLSALVSDATSQDEVVRRLSQD